MNNASKFQTVKVKLVYVSCGNTVTGQKTVKVTDWFALERAVARMQKAAHGQDTVSVVANYNELGMLGMPAERILPGALSFPILGTVRRGY